MVINVRGTNGSGKSTFVRSLLNDPRMFFDFYWMNDPNNVTGKGKPVQVGVNIEREHKIIVLGSYHNATGGCDGIKTQKTIHDLVYAFAAGEHYHVVFEGIVISTIFSSYNELANRLKAQSIPTTFAYMATPLQQCLDNVMRRREAAGRPREGFKTELVEQKYKSIESTKFKFLADTPHIVHTVPYRTKFLDIFPDIAGTTPP